MNKFIGLSVLSLAACSPTTTASQTPDQEQVSVNAIQSHFNAADDAITALSKNENISCYVMRRQRIEAKEYVTRSIVSCSKSIKPTNVPKGEDETEFSYGDFDGVWAPTNIHTFVGSNKVYSHYSLM